MNQTPENDLVAAYEALTWPNYPHGPSSPLKVMTMWKTAPAPGTSLPPRCRVERTCGCTTSTVLTS